MTDFNRTFLESLVVHSLPRDYQHSSIESHDSRYWDPTWKNRAWYRVYFLLFEPIVGRARASHWVANESRHWGRVANVAGPGGAGGVYWGTRVIQRNIRELLRRLRARNTGSVEYESD